MFTCTGDSGAPLWLKDNNDFFIIGIHHGGGKDGKFYDNSNISVKINDQIVNWINSIIKDK